MPIFKLVAATIALAALLWLLIHLLPYLVGTVALYGAVRLWQVLRSPGR